MPATPQKHAPSSPEIVITNIVLPPEPAQGGSNLRSRPLMRLGAPADVGVKCHFDTLRTDFSTLPPALGRSQSSLSSPRPGLNSRFSSDDGLSAHSALPSGVTPGTEMALSAFGIAPGRGSPGPSTLAYPTPPIRSRRRFTDAFTPAAVDADEGQRRRPSPTTTTSALPPSGEEAATPRTPLLDFAHAKALVHRILPGDHRLLRSGETPGVSAPSASPSYFALSPTASS
jgi:hypothetical protein